MVRSVSRSALLFSLVLATLFLRSAQGAGSARLEGIVFKVPDGDSLNVRLDGGKRERVRLIGVNAPELDQRPWGERARRFTRSMVLERRVVIEPGAEPRDKYGRLLAYVFIDGRMLNEELLRNGLAVRLTVPPNTRYTERLAAAEQAARAAVIGIWHPQSGLKARRGEPGARVK